MSGITHPQHQGSTPQAPFTRSGRRLRPRLCAGPHKLISIVFNEAFHTVRTRAIRYATRVPLGLVAAHAREKVLCNIASNRCLHTEREKPALTDSFNDTQWKLAIKTGDKNKYVSTGGGFSPRHVKRIN